MTHLSAPQGTLEVTPAPAIPTYACRAKHQRFSPVARSFDTNVPMVRVLLCENDTPAISTSIGDVLPEDHILFSVDAVRRQFGAELDRPIARVEMITPARKHGSRFSPIALFLGYERHEDALPGGVGPSFFIVEAGTANGEAKVLYLAPTMSSELCYLTGYTPTPLTHDGQIYRSRLTMKSTHEPGELVVEVLADPAAAPHLQITACFSREVLESTPAPLRLTAEAAIRVMTIGRDIGVDVAGVIGSGLGILGASHLAWHDPSGIDEPAPSSRAA